MTAGPHYTDTTVGPFLLRRDAAERLTAAGVPTQPRSLEKAPIPYIVVSKRAVYSTANVEAYAAWRLAQAARRIGSAGHPSQLRQQAQVTTGKSSEPQAAA